MGQVLGTVFGLVAVAGFTAALIVLLRMMLEVTSQGGYCARGGAYVIAHECSAQTAALTPLSILALFVFVGIGVAARGVGLVVAALAWPALFCTLGAGFLYSARYPQFGSATAYGVGGMFLAMGGIPLLLGIAGLLRRARHRRSHGAAGVGESADGVPAAVRHSTTVVLLAAGIAAGWFAADWLLRTV